MTTNIHTYREIDTSEDIERLSDVLSLDSVAIQPQYSHSKNIRGISNLLQEEFDLTNIAEEFLTKVATPESAEGVFLDWWAKRVGVNRKFVMDGKTYNLPDEILRKAIKFQCAVNLSDVMSAKFMNDKLSELLGVNIAVSDLKNMTTRITLDESIDVDTLNYIKYFGVNLVPMGVDLEIIINYESVLGFEGQDLETFDFGVFTPDDE